MKTVTWVVERLAQAGGGATAAAATPATKRFYSRGEFPKGMRMLELALKNSEKRWEQERSGVLLRAFLPETVATP